MKLNKQSHYHFFFLFFSVRRLHAMRLCLYKRSSQAKILKTDEEDQVFNVAENKTNSITYILFQIEVLLRFGATAIVLPGNFF